MKLFSFILGILFLTGCASITRGTSEVFVIQTTPIGASVALSNGLSCTSPCSLKVKRRGDFVVTISKDGYETVTSNISSSIDTGGGAAMAGNVILGGVIGAGIDAGTGAMHSHKPNPLVVTLNPAN
ncbi:MAG: translation initiation factor 2 [Woeseia sp.]|nr:translation initiation factor 2 [Woeseia sp.]|tara:strand:- start:4291 stop:4668 length:378 start_codon:yes stop_codon:yes gene_type:complete